MAIPLDVNNGGIFELLLTLDPPFDLGAASQVQT